MRVVLVLSLLSLAACQAEAPLSLGRGRHVAADKAVAAVIEARVEPRAGDADHIAANGAAERGVKSERTRAARNNRYGVQGPRDNPDPHIARQAALRDAAEFGW